MKKASLFMLVFFQAYFLFSQANTVPINLMESQWKQKVVMDTIPFEFIHHSIIIAVEVLGQQGNFILDTGAPTVLSTSFYERLNLPTQGSVKVRGANNQVQEQAYLVVPEFTIQGLDFTNVPALVMDLEPMQRKKKSTPIDGIIGSSQLKDLILQIDMVKKVIVLTNDIQRLNLQKKESIKMKLDKNHRPFIALNVSGKKTQALLDTGFNGLYAMPIDFYRFHQKYFSAHALKKGGASSSYTTVYGEAVTEEWTLIRCPYVQIGQIRLEKVVTLPYPGQEALLGMELLEEGLVTLDYLHGRFYFKR